MTSSSEIPIGERLRFYRQAQNKKQVVVAGLAGVTEDYLSQIERGLKTPTVTLLHQFARILGVPTSALLGEAPSESETVGHAAASRIHRALTYYTLAHPAEPASLKEVRQRIDAAWNSWHTSANRYTEAGGILPDLIRDTEQAVRLSSRDDDMEMRRKASQTSADLYFLLRTFAKRVGRTDLSLLAADRGVRAAEEAEDPLRVAAAKWNLGHVLLAQNEPEGAEETVIQAAEHLEGHLDEGGAQWAALYGALWLVAVIAAVRKGDGWAARGRLRDYAWKAARQSGDGNVFWTVFGPTNVALHAISIEKETGEIPDALRYADEIDVTHIPSIERRATFFLELAASHDQRREDAAVLLHLQNAEREAPEDMRYNVMARNLVRGLLKRARPTLARQVHELAGRIELYG